MTAEPWHDPPRSRRYTVEWNGCRIGCDEAADVAALAVALAGPPFLGDTTQDPHPRESGVRREARDVPVADRETAKGASGTAPAATSEAPADGTASKRVVSDGGSGHKPDSGPRTVSRREGPPKRRGPTSELTPEERRRIGSIVRAVRQARRMTQTQVAEELGCSMQAVSAIELGRTGRGAGSGLFERALEWAQKPHRLDDAPASEGMDSAIKKSIARKNNPMKQRAARLDPLRGAAPDWRRPASGPMPLAVELYRCEPLNARLTVQGCEKTKASGREDCKGCPGVVALEQRRQAAGR